MKIKILIIIKKALQAYQNIVLLYVDTDRLIENISLKQTVKYNYGK